MWKLITTLLLTISLANACAVCDAEKAVKVTYKVYKANVDVYGVDSKQAKDAKKDNITAWKKLEQARKVLGTKTHKDK